MIQDDYLVRMIRKAGLALQRALGKADEVGDEQTAAAVREALGQVIELPVATWVMLDQESLAPLLGRGSPEASRIAARGLVALAAIEGKNPLMATQARRCRRSAVAIYNRVGIGDDPADRVAATELTRAPQQADPSSGAD